jgi:hypothetical protein
MTTAFASAEAENPPMSLSDWLAALRINRSTSAFYAVDFPVVDPIVAGREHQLCAR